MPEPLLELEEGGEDPPELLPLLLPLFDEPPAELLDPSDPAPEEEPPLEPELPGGQIGVPVAGS